MERVYEFKQNKGKRDKCGGCLWFWPDIRPGSDTAGQMMCFRADGKGQRHELREGDMDACSREGFEPRPRVYDAREASRRRVRKPAKKMKTPKGLSALS